MTERLVVIGGDAAGMSAASQARRLRGPEDLAIVAFEKGRFTSYSACGIPYVLGGVVSDFDDLIVRAPEKFKTRQSIDVLIRHEVTSIDLKARAVTVWDIERGRELTESFDTLVVATGAVPIRPDLPNSDAEGVFGVQTLDHGAAIGKDIEANRPGRAVVVGGGYIGLEMAEAFTSRGIDVTLVEMADEPMSTFDPDMGHVVSDAMRDMGIKLLTGDPVTGFDVEDGRVCAVVTENQTVPADIVVLGLGVRPNVDLARDAGLAVGDARGLVVDQQMKTPVEGVWAAGDCAEKYHRVARKHVAIALGTHANKEGRVAGINIGGGYASFPGVIGTAASKVCDIEVARTGLNQKEAEEAGFEFVTTTIDSQTRAGYYPGAAPIKTKLICEKRSGRLLGAQIVGKEGAAKRIDVLATALWNDMTVDAMLNVDLSYAPPFSPVWDPVLIAARKAWQAVEQAMAEEVARKASSAG